MLGSFITAAVSALALLTQPVTAANNVTVFKPTKLVPFLHVALLVEDSTFVVDQYGILTGQANNQGGAITGNFTGNVLKIGTEFENFPPMAKNTLSTYNNVFSVNTTDGVAMFMTVNGYIKYSTGYLHGFGRMEFSTSSPKYNYLNQGDYTVEFEANFPSGKVSVDLFEMVSAGHW